MADHEVEVAVLFYYTPLDVVEGVSLNSVSSSMYPVEEAELVSIQLASINSK